jgi:hypothetical protein
MNDSLTEMSLQLMPKRPTISEKEASKDIPTGGRQLQRTPPPTTVPLPPTGVGRGSDKAKKYQQTLREQEPGTSTKPGPTLPRPPPPNFDTSDEEEEEEPRLDLTTRDTRQPNPDARQEMADGDQQQVGGVPGAVGGPLGGVGAVGPGVGVGVGVGDGVPIVAVPAAAAPAALHVTDAQLLLLIGRAKERGATKKLTAFTSGDGVAWKTWRSNFTVVATMHDWSQERRLTEARAAMEGEATQVIDDICYRTEFKPGGAWPTLVPAVSISDQLLDLYEARFLPPSATKVARGEFAQAQQEGGQTILRWHVRCREMFIRAHPEIPGGTLETNKILMDKFYLGLQDIAVRRYVYDQSPPTYSAMLSVASGKAVAESIIAGPGSYGFTGGQRPALNALDRENINSLEGGNGVNTTSRGGAYRPVSATCWHCNKSGHLRRDCTAYTKYLDDGNKPQTPPVRGTQPGRGTGRRPNTTGRGGWRSGNQTRGPGSNRRNNSRQLHQIESTGEDNAERKEGPAGAESDYSDEESEN